MEGTGDLRELGAVAARKRKDLGCYSANSMTVLERDGQEPGAMSGSGHTPPFFLEMPSSGLRNRTVYWINFCS